MTDHAGASGALARRHRFGAFYLLALALVAAVMAARLALGTDTLPRLLAYLQEHHQYPNLVSIARFAAEDPRALLIFVFAGAPSMSALAVSWLADGRAGLRRLATRLRPWRGGVSLRQGLIAYGVLLGGYLIVAAGYLVATRRLEGEQALRSLLSLVGGSAAAAPVFLLAAAVVDEGGTLEELGWRGYGLPALFERMHHPLAATLWTGLLWWLWHAPREIPALLAGIDVRYLINQGLFLALCIGLSIVISWFWFRTGGSVWPGVLVHGGTNVWSKALGGPLNQRLNADLRTWLVLALAVLVLLAAGRELGRRDEIDYG